MKQTTDTTIAGLNRRLRALPKLAQAELRDASIDIASLVADEARHRAMRVGGVAKLVAPTIEATRDRVPVVRMGGRQRLPDSGDGWTHGRTGTRQAVGDVIFGAEFGGGRRPTTHQFMPHRGTHGYFLWPTVRDRSDDTQRRYSEALDDALRRM